MKATIPLSKIINPKVTAMAHHPITRRITLPVAKKSTVRVPVAQEQGRAGPASGGEV